MGTQFVCIHGHFYQPPRENPWLEAVELQDSAAPWHDWNERITIECYAPNAAARRVGGDGKIHNITSNYARMSFNFGPTLLAWMQDRMPRVHQAIVDSDCSSRERFSGHGSALAQAYNHVILPLANRRDKVTQVLWGIRDFQHRFGRDPEGMWLAETAVDTETLEVLAEFGIRFTVLSPFQARGYRKIGQEKWTTVDGARIDPKLPYRVPLPSGRSIVVFFYDAPVSQAVAFEKLLSSGERLANRLLGAADPQREADQLIHIATDGESYGHHHRHGEMALAYALQHLETSGRARLTNYGEYLELHPPEHEAQIHEPSAWSCPHGVGRWSRDCGCNSGGHPDWNQQWRAPLREAFDWLRDQTASLFETHAAKMLRDPWGARNAYISIILDRSAENRERFLADQAARELSAAEKVSVLQLMELQRHALLMYTSCGWFFDELSGIETVQVIQYAARVLQLGLDLFGQDLEGPFLERLERAKSNLNLYGDGRQVFEKGVRPARIAWPQAVAHYAISSVFQEYPESIRVFSFTFADEHRERHESGKARLALGRVRVTSEITQESRVLAYAVVYMGEHNLTGSVGDLGAPEAYDAMVRDLRQAFQAAEFLPAIRAMDAHFGPDHYTLKSLFKDEQRRILNEILASTREDLENRFRLITERYTPLMKFLQTTGMPLPPALKSVSDFIMRRDLCHLFTAERLDIDRLQTLLIEAQSNNGAVFDAQVARAIETKMEELATQLAKQPQDIEQIRLLNQLATMVKALPIAINLAEVENTYWELMQHLLGQPGDGERGEPAAREAMQALLRLGDRLGFAADAFPQKPALEPAAPPRH